MTLISALLLFAKDAHTSYRYLLFKSMICTHITSDIKVEVQYIYLVIYVHVTVLIINNFNKYENSVIFAIRTNIKYDIKTNFLKLKDPSLNCSLQL